MNIYDNTSTGSSILTPEQLKRKKASPLAQVSRPESSGMSVPADPATSDDDFQMAQPVPMGAVDLSKLSDDELLAEMQKRKAMQVSSPV